MERPRPVDLGTLHPAWKGWVLCRDGKLWPPDQNEGYAPRDVAFIWLYRGGMKIIEQEIQRLRGPVQYLIEI